MKNKGDINKSFFYVVYTVNDGLPVAYCDTMNELAAFFCTDIPTMRSRLSKFRHNKSASLLAGETNKRFLVSKWHEDKLGNITEC